MVNINIIISASVSLLHEDALDELHGEGGLAHAAAAEHHDLVLPHGRLLARGAENDTLTVNFD